MPNEKRPPEGVATGRVRVQKTAMMREWYGRPEGKGEMLKHLPGTQSLEEVLSRVAEKKLPRNLRLFETIVEHWAEIAGEIAARHTVPLGFLDKTLRVEVEHPAYLTSVRTRAVQAAILTQIEKFIGPDKCSALLFIPAGRRPRI